MATKLYRSGFGDSDEKPENVRKYAKEDWERFLYSICEFVGIQLDWVSVGSVNGTVNDNIPATLVSILYILSKGPPNTISLTIVIYLTEKN